jgi:hypothetical protein
MIKVTSFSIEFGVKAADISGIEKEIQNHVSSLIGPEFPLATFSYKLLVTPDEVLRSDAGLARIVQWHGEVTGVIEVAPMQDAPPSSKAMRIDAQR